SQRTADVLALITAVRTHPAARGRGLRLAARERFTIPALFAAALGGPVDELYLCSPLLSYGSILETEDYNAAFANFAPSILLHTDLPEIAAAVTCPITLAGAVDAKGDPVDAAPLYRAATNVTIQRE